MAQENRIQDGTVVFSAADPTTYDLGFNVRGNANITKTLVVAQESAFDSTISSATGSDLILTIQPGAPANIRLDPPVGGNVLLNNTAWIDNTPNLGGFIGASSTNVLHYYPFVVGNEISDNLTTSYLNTTYPNAVPGQMVTGSTVIYSCVGTGSWRKTGNVNSDTIRTIWSGTQAQYNALVPDPATIYFII